jgi:tetratricopeptide (TPR) repeat protein
MRYLLLLASGDGAAAQTADLEIRELRQFPGKEGISTHFRPIRSDALFDSAKRSGHLASRILHGEGVVSGHLAVEFEVRGETLNVAGRSAELLIVLALLRSRWPVTAPRFDAIAATGALDIESGATLGDASAAAVQAVQHTVSKVAAAVEALRNLPSAVVFYPAVDQAAVAAWRARSQLPPQVHLHPIGTLDEALAILGITLEKTYLGNPFRGLEPFDYAHRSIFFGRDAEIASLCRQLLRREAAGAPGVLVEGASGCGKSSFLRAGVLSALIHPDSKLFAETSLLKDRPVPEGASRAIWRVGLLPQAASEAKAAASVFACWQSYPQLRRDEPPPPTLEALLDWWSQHWPRHLRFVWVLDQLEELFHGDHSDATIEALGAFLSKLQAAGAWSLASIRADAVPLFNAHAALRQVFGPNEGHFYLETVTPDALDDVILRPAAAAALSFGPTPSGKPLDELLRHEAYRDAGNALPLLQFTLAELYLRRVDRTLTYEAYTALQGPHGVVSTLASSVLERLPTEDRIAPPRLFRALVTLDDNGRAMRRYTSLEEIRGDESLKSALAALVEARLCVSDDRDGKPVVSFAHDALLRTWPQLVDWLKEESGLLKARELAERDCRLWEERERSTDWLANRDKLALFTSLRAAELPLPGAVPEFIALSERRMRRLAAVKGIAMSAIVLLAMLASAMGLEALRKAREAEFQAKQARREQLRAETEAHTSRATVEFLSTIFDAPTPENSLGRLITARELLDAGAQRLNTTLRSAPQINARLTARIGKAYRQLGEYDRAQPLLETAVTQFAALPDLLPEDRANLYTEAARLYDAIDRHDKARAMLIEAARWEQRLSTERRSALPDILRAEIETADANFIEAQAALERAAAILEARHQPEDRENYELLLHYSRLHVEQGRFPDAERFGLQAIEAQRRVLGESDPTAIDAAINMQLVYLQMHTPTRAEPYGWRAREIAKAIFGEQHPRYASVLMDYADVVGAAGRPQDAERLLREALAIRLKTLGPNHTSTGYSYYNLGNAVADQGRNAEALPLIVRSQRIWETSEGREHPDVAWALDMEARLLTALGHSAEAIRLALQGRAISEKAYGPLHPNVGRSWMRLGDAHLKLGEYQQSVDDYEHALHIFELAYGAKGPRVGEVLEKYARALRHDGRAREAKAAYARARQISGMPAASD